MAEYKTIAKTSDLAPGQLKHIEVDVETQICLANIDGTFYAISGECTHMGGPLGEGELDGTVVTCPWHSAEFDVTSGAVVAEPAEDPQTKYELRVEGDEVQVEIG